MGIVDILFGLLVVFGRYAGTQKRYQILVLTFTLFSVVLCLTTPDAFGLLGVYLVYPSCGLVVLPYVVSRPRCTFLGRLYPLLRMPLVVPLSGVQGDAVHL